MPHGRVHTNKEDHGKIGMLYMATDKRDTAMNDSIKLYRSGNSV